MNLFHEISTVTRMEKGSGKKASGSVTVSPKYNSRKLENLSMFKDTSKEKDILVSGVMFLVALQTFSRLSIIASGKMVLCGCHPLVRFANYMFIAVLIAAVSLSFTISIFYFKSFSHKICHPFIDRENSEEETEDEEEASEEETEE